MFGFRDVHSGCKSKRHLSHPYPSPPLIILYDGAGEMDAWLPAAIHLEMMDYGFKTHKEHSRSLDRHQYLLSTFYNSLCHPASTRSKDADEWNALRAADLDGIWWALKRIQHKSGNRTIHSNTWITKRCALDYKNRNEVHLNHHLILLLTRKNNLWGSRWFETLLVSQHMIDGTTEIGESTAHKCSNYPRLLLCCKQSMCWHKTHSWCNCRIRQKKVLHGHIWQTSWPLFFSFSQSVKGCSWKMFLIISISLSFSLCVCFPGRSLSFTHVSLTFCSPINSLFPSLVYKQSSKGFLILGGC